ncbi:unnamed protein product, partial [Brassica napus]
RSSDDPSSGEFTYGVEHRILPHDACGLYNKCGPNGICDTSRSRICGCIHGFKPRDQEAWGFQDWTGGCMRKTKLNCSGDG